MRSVLMCYDIRYHKTEYCSAQVAHPTMMLQGCLMSSRRTTVSSKHTAVSIVELADFNSLALCHWSLCGSYPVGLWERQCLADTKHSSIHPVRFLVFHTCNVELYNLLSAQVFKYTMSVGMFLRPTYFWSVVDDMFYGMLIFWTRHILFFNYTILLRYYSKISIRNGSIHQTRFRILAFFSMPCFL